MQHDKMSSFFTWKIVLLLFPQEMSLCTKTTKKQNTTFCTNRRTSSQHFRIQKDSFPLSLTNMVISVSVAGTPVCRCLPRPPEGAVDWTLLFGDAGLDCGAQKREVSLSQVVIRGRLQLVVVLHQSSLLLMMLLLLQLCQDTNCHLQDVCFLQLGVWLLFEELWTQERLELLNAAVDSLSA